MSAPLRSGSCLVIVLLTLGVLPGSAELRRWSATPAPTALQRTSETTSGAVAPLGGEAPTLAARELVAPDAGSVLAAAITEAVASSGVGAETPDPARVLTPLTPQRSTTARRAGAAAPVPAALVAGDVGLRQGPVPLPLALQLPTIGVGAEVLGVGITPADVMDAPMGGAGDPVWQQAFWYRGSAVPGAASTALIAGHISGSGDPGVFAELGQLRRGDPIVVRDTRTGLDVRFEVDDSISYTRRGG